MSAGISSGQFTIKLPTLPSSCAEYAKKRDLNKNFFTKEWIQRLRSSIQEEHEERERLRKERLELINNVAFNRDNWLRTLRIERSRLIYQQVKCNTTIPHLYQYQGYRERRDYDEEEEEEKEEESDDDSRLLTLPREVVEVVEDLLSRRKDDLIVEDNGVEVRVRDLDTLRGTNWLNDEIINFYFQLIQKRSVVQKEQTNIKVYCFNTFFYKRLKEGGHKALKRWTKKVDLFSYDLILIPVHLTVHWTLAAISIRDSAINYYDSMNGNNHECLSLLLEYIKDERKDKKGDILDTSSWTRTVVKGIPQQENGSDCGVFTCKYAERLALDKQFNFSQKHIPFIRNLMIYEIFCKEISNKHNFTKKR